jgi:hypothetical protein
MRDIRDPRVLAPHAMNNLNDDYLKCGIFNYQQLELTVLAHSSAQQPLPGHTTLASWRTKHGPLPLFSDKVGKMPLRVKPLV